MQVDSTSGRGLGYQATEVSTGQRTRHWHHRGVGDRRRRPEWRPTRSGFQRHRPSEPLPLPYARAVAGCAISEPCALGYSHHLRVGSPSTVCHRPSTHQGQRSHSDRDRAPRTVYDDVVIGYRGHADSRSPHRWRSTSVIPHSSRGSGTRRSRWPALASDQAVEFRPCEQPLQTTIHGSRPTPAIRVGQPGACDSRHQP